MEWETGPSGAPLGHGEPDSSKNWNIDSLSQYLTAVRWEDYWILLITEQLVL